MIFRYRKIYPWVAIATILGIPLMLLMVVFKIDWVIVILLIARIGAEVYLWWLWRCPYCDAFLPSERDLVRFHDRCCPNCGMDIPDREEDLDESFFTGEE